MTAFLWTIIVVLAMSMIGQGIAIATHDEKRDLRFTTGDLVISTILLGWAVRLLP